MKKSANESVITYANRIGARCPNCEYKLKGLTKPQCPECGKHFTLDELVSNRYAPKLYIITGIGFFASSILLGITIVLWPLAFVYFAITVWWGGGQQTVAEMSLRLRRVLVAVAWFPILGFVGFVAIFLVRMYI